MSVPTGPASLLDIQNEFGGSAPIGLNEYYAGGGYVGNPPPTSVQQIGAIPTSGTITIGNFLGVSAQFIFNDVVAVDTVNYNLRNRAIAAGWDGVKRLVASVTINGGVYVYSTSPSVPAFELGTPTPPDPTSTIDIQNYGTIEGAGGAGGTGGSVSGATLTNGTNGGAGGIGISLNYNVTMRNFGIIGGGGGGGGGGGATRHDPTGKMTDFIGASGGGGGGGRAGGAGGAAGTSTGNTTNGVASAGSAGTLAAAGAGGARFVIGSQIGSGPGGNGGDLGQNGKDGLYGDLLYANGGYSAPGTGGLAGLAISGGNYISWYYHGTLVGSVDSFGIYVLGTDYTSNMGTRKNYVQGTPLNGAWTGALGSPWYWNVKNAGITNVPGASITFSTILTNNTGVSFNAHLYGAVDDSLVSMTLNGVGVAPGTAMGYPTVYSTNNFVLPQGMSVLTVVLNNASFSSAGFNLRVRRTSDNLVIGGPTGWFY